MPRKDRPEPLDGKEAVTRPRKKDAGPLPPKQGRLLPRATVQDVELRWGQAVSDAEAALIDIRLADVERMILRRVPDLIDRVYDGRVFAADIVQVEADVVLRLMRNPEGFIAETDGDYSYQRAKELSTGRLNILDEEFEALGLRRSRMSILVPEPMVEGGTVDATAPTAAGITVFDIIVPDEAALLPSPSQKIAVVRDTATMWMFDPLNANANANGWVQIGGAGTGLADGVQQGQLIHWNAALRLWEPADGTVAFGDGYTLAWSNRKQQWTVAANALDSLYDVQAAARFGGGKLVTGDALAWDDAAKQWVVVAPSEFIQKLILTDPQPGHFVVWNGTNWVNTGGYTAAEIDSRLSGLASGLARKPAVNEILGTPPPAPVVGETYIIARRATGDWAGHDDETVFWDGSQWVFGTPSSGDTHAVLSTNQSVNWNGTDWVLLGSQASSLGELQDVTLTQPVGGGNILFFDGTKWINSPPPAPPKSALNDLTDVTSVPVADGEVLRYVAADGMWKPSTPPASTLDGLTDVATGSTPNNGDILMYDSAVKQWTGKAPQLVTSPLGGLTDVDTATTAPADGNALVWDATAARWVPKAPATALTSLTDVDLATTPPTDKQLLAFDDADKKWKPAVAAVSRLSDVDVKTNPPNDGHTLLWDTTESKWLPKPLQVRNLSDVQYPLDPNAIIDRSTLVYNTTTQQWYPALAQAAVTDWDAFIDYPKGALIYHNGYFWHALRNIPKAGHASPNPEPVHVVAGAHATYTHDGKQSWTQITAVERAATINQVPVTPVPAHDAGRMVANTTNYNVLMYVSDTEWVVWSLRLDTAAMAGVGPDDPLPYRWVVNPHYTATTPRSVWRNIVAPTAPPEDAATLWIYGEPTDTTIPAAPVNEVDWASYPLTSYLASLADVNAATAALDNILVFNGAKWVAVTNPAYTKAEVDAKTTALNARIETLIHGLEHGAAVNSIAASPPAGAEPGDLYIVGPNPAGAWAGHANKIAYLKVDRTWDLVAPEANESHLVEDQQATFSWNGTAWVKVATSATGSTAQSGVGEILPWLADTIPGDYLECKGQVVAISTYPDLYAVLGNKYNAGIADGVTTFALPDLRGYFLRGTEGTGGAATRGAKQEDSTARPKVAFTTDAAGNHFHNVGLAVFGSDANTPIVNGYNHSFLGANRRTTANVAQDFSATLPGTNQSGSHNHQITGGGDAETRPKSVAVTWIIRWKAINGGAQGPKGPAGTDTWTVGSIQQTTLTETQFRTALGINTDDDRKWVLADGRNVAGSKYHQITGSDHVPDLRGAFLRMAGANNVKAGWNGGTLAAYQEDSTAPPKNAFGTSSQGSHTHNIWSRRMKAYSGYGYSSVPQTLNEGINCNGVVSTDGRHMDADGAHTHTITGGDTETRPKTYAVNYMIKIG